MADQLDVAHRLDAHHADQRAVGLIAPETPAAISPSRLASRHVGLMPAISGITPR